MDNWTNAKLCDVANLILGAILFFSPWMFAFEAGRASENAYVAGIVIAVLAIAALAAFAVWEEWLNLIVVGAGFTLDVGLPGKRCRDEGSRGHRCGSRHPCRPRTLDHVAIPAALDSQPLRRGITTPPAAGW